MAKPTFVSFKIHAFLQLHHTNCRRMYSGLQKRDDDGNNMKYAGKSQSVQWRVLSLEEKL